MDRARLGPAPDPGPDAGDDRHDRGHARRPLGREVPAWSRRIRTAGLGGLARRVVRPPAGAHARVRRDRPGRAGPRRAARIRRRGVPAARRRHRPWQAAQAARATGAAANPNLSRRDKTQGGRARDLAQPWLAMYLGGMGAKGKNFYVETAERFGHGDSARRVQDLFMAGDRAGAAAALSTELIDSCAVCCRTGELDERLAEYERAGATTLLVMPFGDRPRIVDALAAALGSRA